MIKNIAKKEKDKQLEDGLTDEQRAFVEYNGKNSIVLSSIAGSGKSHSAILRLKYLIEKKKIDPKKIIFFSYTKAAVEELKSRIQHENIKITTIHAFCQHILGKTGKYKNVVSFYDFIKWFKQKNSPSQYATKHEKTEFNNIIFEMYDNAEMISAGISAFKLQSLDGIKLRIPSFWKEYNEFLRQTRSRDFSDMLIDVRNLLKEEKWLRMFKNKYDYIFIDEYQDTAVIQSEILLALNSKHYLLIGDRSQSIFKFANANCDKVEALLKKRRKVDYLNLRINFRSAPEIVENSNKYSLLKGNAFDQSRKGIVDNKLLTFDGVVDLFKSKQEVVALGRTNSVLREIEKRMLIRKIPMRYFNFLKDHELDEMKTVPYEELNHSIQGKIDSVIKSYGSIENLLNFINDNKNHKSYATTIHKFKGREADCVVVFNCMSPEIIKYNNINLSADEYKFLSFYEDKTFDSEEEKEENDEARNIFYVAITRPRNYLYFSLIDIK